jgi:hypothetical protein
MNTVIIQEMFSEILKNIKKDFCDKALLPDRARVHVMPCLRTYRHKYDYAIHQP